jgi:hypothetical protein
MNTLKDAAYSGSLGGMQTAAGGATQAGATGFGAGLSAEASKAIANPMAVNAAAPGFGSQMLSQAGTNLGNTYSGIGELVKDPAAAYGRFTEAGGTASQLAMPVGGAVLAGLEPSDLGYGTGNLYNDPDKGKYRGPQGQLNLSDRFDTGLRLATGGSIQSGGIRDLYGTPDNQPTISPGLSGFGLGRLNNLAGEQAMTQAQTLGYVKGGYLDGQGDGMSDSIPATIEGKQPARLADGEFVIPADVVSHLGNGSSKAGSKRLYAMLDKVRHARTGNKKQGKEINPAKYMPA